MMATRLAEALFDDRLDGLTALPQERAIYGDAGLDLAVSAALMAEQIAVAGVDAVIVVDNCTQRVHGQLAQIVRRGNSHASLLTIDYDVLGEQPAGTLVALGGNSEDILRGVLEQRFPRLTDAERRHLGEFSGGNARIVLKIAEAGGKDIDLSKLKDSELLERLFQSGRQQADGKASGAVPTGPQAQLIRTDPLRIASSGDAKTDAAIGAVLKRRVGIPKPLLDEKSFPVTRAGANVLLYSLGSWEAFPTGPDQEDEHVRQIWRSHRAWLVWPVLPAANPLFTFVSGKVGGDLSRIKALLVRGKIESDLLIAVDGKGAVIAGACHTSPYEDEVTQCLQRVALALPPLDRDRQEVRPVAARVLTSVIEPTVSWLQRADAAISNAFQWLLSALRHLFSD